jgi:hypothetical protein
MMNDSTRVMHRPRRARPPVARTAAAIIAAAALALLAAACGSSPSSAGSGGSSNAGGSAKPSTAGGSANARLVVFSRCMRSHGVPNFPDPTNGGSSGPIFNITQAGISDAASHTSQFETKLTECGRLAGTNAPESFE